MKKENQKKSKFFVLNSPYQSFQDGQIVELISKFEWQGKPSLQGEYFIVTNNEFQSKPCFRCGVPRKIRFEEIVPVNALDALDSF